MLEKKVLVTAGGTYEPIDPVRFIGNHSTGKMGIAIAKALLEIGATVHLVVGYIQIDLPPAHPRLQVYTAKRAEEMYQICLSIYPEVDLVIMAAAVADYRPMRPAQQKIKKNSQILTLELVKNPDILKTLGAQKKHQILVGFALETENGIDHAQKKRQEKNLDLIVLNQMGNAATGFGYDTNEVDLFFSDGLHKKLAMDSKINIARQLIALIQTKYFQK